MKKILSIKNLKKIYHTKKDETLAIEDFTLDINEGDFIAIVGPSGCGKSTILSILCNLEKKSGGEIIFNNDIKLGYMLQQDCLFEWKNILENCLIGLEINKNLNTKTKNRVLNLLTKYGLKDFIYFYPDNLSGGMRQRVALIRTLATNPNLLLMDEPFSALDYQSRLNISNDIYNILKSEKKSMILVTHDISEAVSICNKVIVLTNRPAKIKNIYDIKLDNPSTPINNRKDNKFQYYYDLIWKDIDNYV